MGSLRFEGCVVRSLAGAERVGLKNRHKVVGECEGFLGRAP
jgi:hypothetical protein